MTVARFARLDGMQRIRPRTRRGDRGQLLEWSVTGRRDGFGRRTAAIWSLCVSKVDLVTLLFDIEKESDQIDLLRRHALRSDPGRPVPVPSPRPTRIRLESQPT